MSLKKFHFFFIIAVIVMTLVLGHWFYDQHNNIAAGLCGLAVVGLLLYLRKMVLWLSTVSLWLLAVSSSAHACSVCFGNVDSPAVKGMANGILLMLAVVVFLWFAFGSFFYYLWKKQKECREVSI